MARQQAKLPQRHPQGACLRGRVGRELGGDEQLFKILRFRWTLAVNTKLIPRLHRLKRFILGRRDRSRGRRVKERRAGYASSVLSIPPTPVHPAAHLAGVSSLRLITLPSGATNLMQKHALQPPRPPAGARRRGKHHVACRFMAHGWPTRACAKANSCSHD